jgi:hypothetical protein
MNQSRFSGGVYSFLCRLAVSSILCWALFTLYTIIQYSQPSSTARVVMMPSWVPFLPAFAPVYMAMLPIPWLLPLAIRDAGRFYACLLAFACAWLLAMPWWILDPTILPRPPLPEGWWNGVYRSLARVDTPNNVMPAAHGIGPVVAAWFTVRNRPAWRWPLVGMLALGLPSIAFVWQHRPIDIVLGTLAAAIGIAVGEVLIHRGQTRSKSFQETAA